MNRPGAYVLFLRLDEAQAIRVGRLPAPRPQAGHPEQAGVAAHTGRHTFPPGWYAYTGSARGPGGLAARVARHLKRGSGAKRLHWHVDYLRERARAVEVWARPEAPRRTECEWAAALGGLPGAEAGPPRFGASDCRCAGHLVRLAGSPPREWLRDALGIRLVAASAERLAELVAGLTRGEDDEREAVVQDLAGLGTAVSQVVDLLQSADPDARWWAARALAACAPRGDLATGQALIAALADPTPEVRACAALALGELGAPEAARALACLLGDDDALVAFAAGSALARIGEAATAALVEVLRSSSPPRVRALAVRALGRIGAPGSAAALWEALSDDPNYLVHHHAYAALEAMGELEPVFLIP